MNRKALTLILFILGLLIVADVTSMGFAENSWVWKSSMRVGRSGLGVAVVNGKIFAIGGANASGFSLLNEEYDQATGTWALRTPMPTPRSDFGIAVHHDKIYCIGGYVSGSATGVNEVYDPATDTWETKASISTPTLNVRANVVDSKIYVIGGNTNQTLNQVYDTATDSWTTKTKIPTAVISYASAVVDNKIYIFTSKLTQIYDVENDAWSLGTPAPSPMVLAVAGATTGMFAPKRIYVFGADAELPYWQLTTRKFTTQSYDPEADSWAVCASMPTGRFDAGVAVINDLFYVIGGFTIDFPSDRLTPNAIYSYSALNQQYTPLGYGATPPKISVVSPENKTYNSGNVFLAFTWNKPVDWVGYSLDGEENVTVMGNVTLTDISNGWHNITIYAKDEFGNIGRSETVTFSITSVPFPTAPVAVASAASVALAGLGVLVYFRKRKRQVLTVS